MRKTLVAIVLFFALLAQGGTAGADSRCPWNWGPGGTHTHGFGAWETDVLTSILYNSWGDIDAVQHGHWWFGNTYHPYRYC